MTADRSAHRRDATGEGGGGRRAGYRRDGFTWAAFAALAAFGFLNAILGPALPYLRSVEHISYLVGALHQVAFAVGGGLAGLLAVYAQGHLGRAATIRLGLAGAALAGIGIGYGNHAAVTIAAALLVSLLATAALIRLWAALADAHPTHRAVAMTEGEVSVSAGGIIAPLLISALAATVVSWRFAFVLVAAIVAAAVLITTAVAIPPSPAPASRVPVSTSARRRLPAPTLVLLFAIVALEFSLSFWLASYLTDSVGLSRELAVTMVSVLYAANLIGRLLASRLARHLPTDRVLAAAILAGLAGMPFLLTATSAATAAFGLAVTGAGIGATFPLASSMHVAASQRSADNALGGILTTAALGQILGPLMVAAIAQTAGLRLGLLTLPALAVLAAVTLVRHHATRPRNLPTGTTAPGRTAAAPAPETQTEHGP